MKYLLRLVICFLLFIFFNFDFLCQRFSEVDKEYLRRCVYLPWFYDSVREHNKAVIYRINE